MDVTFMGAEHKLAGHAPRWRYRYRTALAALLLPSLLLIGVFSYYPAVRSLIGGFYQCNPVKADMVVNAADSWLWQATGLASGARLADRRED